VILNMLTIGHPSDSVHAYDRAHN